MSQNYNIRLAIANINVYICHIMTSAKAYC